MPDLRLYAVGRPQYGDVYVPIVRYGGGCTAAIGKSQSFQSRGCQPDQYEGDNTVFVWKHPLEDFNLGSQLIVHESQEALLFRNGRALDLFPAGR